MATGLQKKRWDELMRVRNAIDKGENLLSNEEIYFIQTLLACRKKGEMSSWELEMQ